MTAGGRDLAPFPHMHISDAPPCRCIRMPKRGRQMEEPKAQEKASATGKVSNEANDLWLDSPYASRFNVESAPKNRSVVVTNQHCVISTAPE